MAVHSIHRDYILNAILRLKNTQRTTPLSHIQNALTKVLNFDLATYMIKFLNACSICLQMRWSNNNCSLCKANICYSCTSKCTWCFNDICTNCQLIFVDFDDCEELELPICYECNRTPFCFSCERRCDITQMTFCNTSWCQRMTCSDCAITCICGLKHCVTDTTICNTCEVLIGLGPQCSSRCTNCDLHVCIVCVNLCIGCKNIICDYCIDECKQCMTLNSYINK